ncbi:MAG: 5-formyltetrahydrofolate cyclo-ligase [Oscillospiraceae bacterium]
MRAEKAALREYARELCLKAGKEYIRSCDERLTKRLLELPEYLSAKTVFCYWGMGFEPDTSRIIENALDAGKTVALPVVYGAGVMRAHIITDISQLNPGTFGIPAPSENMPVLEPENIDLAVVPAVAFDRENFRLGRGGGYYDRYLSRTRAFTVGLTCQRLLLEKVPREEYDIPVNCIITEEITARLRLEPRRD